ncbi:membrane protein [Defluviimonas sp. 20V17]|uniref:Membrane protein n=1 Tax=Allgaiera indica TaxID=765699 RepID=A0AAN4UTP5_9RHOB|nr:OmpA family protein [Allgaiera indica]KDB05457.1 membrane protein [Defluviimonas sp. 20V17]GHE04685.1 membrane protein [Allgaiera indica]SDX47272.1 Outer membrane protein OmpA [Allgaiera indica]
MMHPIRGILTAAALAVLAGCSGQTIGGALDHDTFGDATANNAQLMSGQRPYAVALDKRFAAQVPNTVNFAFNRATLDEGARAVLRRQASWIREFPEVRFRVFGYTDKVGSERYNKALGMRRAEAVVNYLVSQGISRRRLQAVISYGETRPLIDTPAPERANRRAVTHVSGFVQNSPLVLNGKYAAVIFREYVASAVPGDNLQTTTNSAATGGTSGGTGG